MTETAFTIFCGACVASAIFIAIYKTVNGGTINGKVVVVFLTFATCFAVMLQPEPSDGEPMMQALGMKKMVGVFVKEAFKNMVKLVFKI